MGFLSVLWGGSFFFVEVALGGLPALSIVWARVAGAAVLMALWILLRGGAFPTGAGVWAALAVQGLLNNAVPFTLFALAQGRIDGALAAIVNATTPLWAVLAVHFLARDERLTAARLIAIVLGFSGVVVMSGGQGAGTALAVLGCLGAALSYALAGVWARRFKPMGLAPEGIALGQLGTAALMLLPLWLAVDRPWTMAAPPSGVLGAMAGLIVLSTGLAYLIFFRLLASAGAINLSLVTFLIPVSAMGLGVGFLGEALLARHVGGFALIVAGLVAIDGRVWRWARG
ncbi:MAG: DMT family transporter [Paracoccaceae bacterium]